MVEFCQECSLRIFDRDRHDFAGLITAEDTAGGWAAQVECGVCGPIMVDHEGRRHLPPCQGGKAVKTYE